MNGSVTINMKKGETLKNSRNICDNRFTDKMFYIVTLCI